MMTSRQKVQYGNWVSWRILLVPAVLALICFALSPLWVYIIAPGAILLLAVCYFAYARFLFSEKGRNVQKQVHELILKHLDWDGQGKLLDIGCGSAALTVQLSKKYPKSTMVGTDYWSKNWEYSKTLCETNAEIEGVGNRITFRKASASSLPFEDGEFDAVVSNLVFHEVRDEKDKLVPLREAFRILRKGGRFALQDLFLERRMFGDPDDLCNTIRSWGVGRVDLVRTNESAFIPRWLKLPFMVGTLGLLTGEK